MNRTINLVALGHTASLFLAFTFTVCVAFDVTFPQWAMFGVWQRLLPGFEGISWKSYFIGVVESYAYGWYFALVWAPFYNFFVSRGQR
jgi:cytochrome c biogenesis protein CcdA